MPPPSPRPTNAEPDAPALTRRQDGHGSQSERLAKCGLGSHSHATEEDVANDALALDRDQAQLGDEGRRTMQRLDKTRLVGLPEGFLVDLEDLLTIRWLLWPDRQHALSLASDHLRVGGEHRG